MSTKQPALKLNKITKKYGTESRPVEVLNGIAFEMLVGDSLAITGPSGCGKSTLLHLIGTLDTPTSGSIEIDGQDPTLFSEPELALFRNSQIGFVFQDHHLLPQYSVLENVLIPTMASKAREEDVQARAAILLDRVGLSDRVTHRPSELSGGERQRVAIARALINKPSVLLCDEPTGNLDKKTAETVADLFFQLHEEEKNLLIVVTHSLDLAKRLPRRFELEDGRCVEA